MIDKKVAELLNQALRDARDAADRGDTAALVAATRDVERAQALAAELSRLTEAVEGFGQRKQMATGPIANGGTVAAAVSAKTYGEQRRREWVTNNAPSLTAEKGQIYRTPSGTRIGIAFATERRKPDKWFLGLPADSFDEAILLCETKHGDLHALHLDAAFLGQYGSVLSRSADGLKFNVYRNGSGFTLGLPGRRRVPIKRYNGGF